MLSFSIEDAAKLAEASYSSARITSPKVMRSLSRNDVEAHILEGNILLLPGSNSIADYLKYNLRILRLGHRRLRMDDNQTEKGASGTIWHQGFLAYSSVVYEWLKDIQVKPTFVIGHSLGAAATQILSKSYGVPGIGFAAPRTKWVRGPVKHHRKCLLINRHDDIVPKAPGSFHHMGEVKELMPNPKRNSPAHSMKHYRAIVEDGLRVGVLQERWSGA